MRLLTLPSLIIVTCICLSAPLAYAEHPTTTIITKAVTKTIDLLKAQKTKEERITVIQNQVYSILLPMIDFTTFSKLVLARNANKFNDAQKSEFTNLLQDLLLQVYRNTFANYTNQTVSFLPFRKQSKDTRSIVSFTINQPSGDKTKVDFLLHKRGDNPWLVYDIKVENISLVSSYRLQVQDTIEQKGVKNLISSFRQKVADGKK